MFLLLKSKIQIDIPKPAEVTKENDQRQTKIFEDSVFNIQDIPVMESVLEALSIIGKHEEITIRGKGKLISNAVTIALIITEKMMNGHSKIYKIAVDSEPIQELGGAMSSIEIILRKN